MVVCEVCGKRGIHPECEKRSYEAQLQREARCSALAAELAPQGGYGTPSPEAQASLSIALGHLQHYLGFSPEAEREQAIQGEGWWFIPAASIGTIGFIVEAQSGSVFPLVSGLVALHASEAWPAPWCAIREYLSGKVVAAGSSAA